MPCLCLQKIIMVSAPWWILLEVSFLTLQERFVYGLRHQTETQTDEKQQYPRDIVSLLK